jgi:hypothetical protein
MHILKNADDLLNKRRYYNGKNWHAVNVKRYNDTFDLNTQSEYVEELQNLFDSPDEYYFFLSTEWDQLKYELSDLHNIFDKGQKHYHLPFEYVNLDSLHLNGRSGGWACFESDLDNLMNEFNYEKNESESQDIESIKKCIEEVEFITDYIDTFNKNLKYQDYVDAHVDIREDEIKESIKNKQIKTITPLTTSKNQQIARHAKGIIKELLK